MNNSYHLALNLSTGRAIITKSKTEIARHLEISTKTVYRQLAKIVNTDIVVNKDYIISKCLELHRQKKGGSRSLKRIRYQEMMSEAAKMVSNQLDYERYQQ